MSRTKLKATVNQDGTVTMTDLSTQPTAKVRTTCRACQSSNITEVMSLGDQYLVNFVPSIDHSLPRAPLDLMRCSDCGLLQLRHTVNPDLLYREFWYRSSVNQTMRDALKNLVDDGLKWHKEGRWLDIGANDGYLLSILPPTFTRIACEPARNFTADLHKVSDHVIDDYFSANHDFLRGVGRRGGCDVITSAAMFYDLDDPDTFVDDIVKCLSPDGVWINQLNDSPTMLKQNAFDAICHEHLCYYDVKSLAALYNRHGLSIVDISYNDVNGSSVRITAKQTGLGGIPLLAHRSVSAADAEAFAHRTVKWKANMLDLLHGPLATTGGMWCYGASTKGCCLLQYLDAPGSFKAIADRNPAKFGTLMAGTWLPVMPEQEMRDERPKHVMVLPWGFKKEFVERERELLADGTTMVFPLPTIEEVL